ncbi:MAG: hypothetical protein N4A31_01220 [Rickettsiales bacterium]|jgi:hypothetical protein|nr:hypothetical protein [Rickettsiales bacterium]
MKDGTTHPERNIKLFFTSNKFLVLPEIHLKYDIFLKNKPVVLIHNSKTGGTSLNYFMRIVTKETETKELFFEKLCDNQIISNVFTKGCIGALASIKELEHLLTPFLAKQIKAPYIYGHMPLPSHPNEPDKNYFGMEVNYITIVREPGARMKSWGNYFFQKNIFTKDEVINLMQNVEIDNLQTRALAGEEYMSGECTEETYTKAIQNIKEIFTIVAPNEAVDDVMALMANHYGVEDVAYSRAAISGVKLFTEEDEDYKELLSKILERNQFDIKLYDYVKTTHWPAWKEEHIESISDNMDDNKTYKVMTAPFYKKGELLYLTLEQMNSLYPAEQEVDLIGLNQN